MAVDVLVPPVGQTVDTMTLVGWYKKEGDSVEAGEPLFSLETDKANLDVESPASGILRAVTAQPGDEVKVLSRLAIIAGPDEQVDPPAAPAVSQAHVRAAGPAAAPCSSSLPAASRLLASPRARRLAEQEGVSIVDVQATGPQGAIVERDVRQYLAQRKAAALGLREPAITPLARRVAEDSGLEWRNLAGSGPAGRVTRDDVAHALDQTRVAAPAARDQEHAMAPLSGVRGIIAERMWQSHSQTAPVTLSSEADVTDLVELRSRLAKDGVNAAYNDLFVFILARALREHPRLNASLDGDTIREWHDVHIGIAVDTARGLLVPVLRDVDRKGLSQISEESSKLIERAQHGQCTPDELRGGRFTLTNLGMLGIDVFTPIINLPECAILGVGRIKMQPVMSDGAVVGRQMVWLSLTFDHRLVDGAPAARFLQRVVDLCEHPHLLLT